MPSLPTGAAGAEAVCWLEANAEERLPLEAGRTPRLLVVFDGAMRLVPDRPTGPISRAVLEREDSLVLPTGHRASASALCPCNGLLIELPTATPPPRGRREPTRDPFVWRVARVLRGEMLGPSDHADGFAQALILSLSEHVTEGPAGAPSEETIGSGAVLHAAVVEMHNEIEGRLRIDRLAHSLGMQTPHFGRGFKRQTGMSPSQFFVRMRVDCAKQMLDERRSLTDTWTDCGFYDQAHFSRHFKRLVGVSPTRFLRERAAGEPES